jgi:hypothetical protein
VLYKSSELPSRLFYSYHLSNILASTFDLSCPLIVVSLSGCCAQMFIDESPKCFKTFYILFCNAWCIVFRFSCDACTGWLLSLEVESYRDDTKGKMESLESFWKASVTWVPLLPDNLIIIFMCMCLIWWNITDLTYYTFDILYPCYLCVLHMGSLA